MADLAQERPCIHVCLIGGADEALYRWVEVGAEEEGVPTRKVPPAATDLIAAAYAAAQSSRFDIGLSLDPQRIVLHETHMPLLQPVLAFDLGLNAQRIARLMGSNAARLVVRLPLRFKVEDEVPVRPPEQGKPARPALVAAMTEPCQNSAQPSAGPSEMEALTRAMKCEPSVHREPVNGLTAEAGQIDPKMVARIVARILRERGIL
ncbi:MAG: hypothetical protein HC875_10120 [Anaerolineales bacterium]|nr:hypothetical protein [Anaerolineales bacterium]